MAYFVHRASDFGIVAAELYKPERRSAGRQRKSLEML